MYSLSPAQLEALVYNKQMLMQASSPAASDMIATDEPTAKDGTLLPTAEDDSSAMLMLSPPLSPYPRLAELVVVDKQPVLSETRVKPIELPRPATPTRRDSLSIAPRKVPVFKPSAIRPAQVKSIVKPSAPFKISKHDPAKPLVSNVWNAVKADPKGYFAREKAYLELYSLNGPAWSNYVPVEPVLSLPATLLLRASGGRSASRSGLRRRRAAGADSMSEGESDQSSSMTTRSSVRGVGAAPSGLSNSLFVSSGSYSDVPTRRPASRAGGSRPSSRSATPNRRATASPAPSRVHDLSLSQLTDYSPPASALPNGKSLRADWKGAPMDLSQDPNAHLLHPAEVHLASVLRLPADVYLDSKKRLFAEKVHRMRQGLPFRRTDSQKACRIDVNKASRLFSAFEKVGWLEDVHFKQYL